MISTNTIVAIEFIGLFGAVMWFGWRQAKGMERSIAEDKRKAAEAAGPPKADA
jgi:hypothetical protein